MRQPRRNPINTGFSQVKLDVERGKLFQQFSTFRHHGLIATNEARTAKFPLLQFLLRSAINISSEPSLFMRIYQGLFRHFAAAVIVLALPFVSAAQVAKPVLWQGDIPAFALIVPAAAKITSTNGYLHIQTTNLSLHIWAVTNAATVNDAVPHAAEIIKSEFVKFKPVSTTDITVDVSPAKRVIGSGNEADDNDPGNAEVVFFTFHGRVFAACVHGEADDASKARDAMMIVLGTVHSELDDRLLNFP